MYAQNELSRHLSSDGGEPAEDDTRREWVKQVAAAAAEGADKANVMSVTKSRGFITNYLTSLSIDQIIQNTMTGFLTDLIRKRGNEMRFDTILAYT